MLGFRSREPISILQGKALNAKISGYDVRPATEADADACNRLCRQVHGHDRNGELIDAIRCVRRGRAQLLHHWLYERNSILRPRRC